MSFRLFIYYCAVIGGWGAFLGWGLGRVLAPEGEFGRAIVKGLLLGLFVALGVSLVDALGSLSFRQASQVGVRVIVALGLGAVGGVIGALVGQLLVSVGGDWAVFLIFGWAVTGAAVGASVGTYDLLGGARRKVVNGVVGGALGGTAGGILYCLLDLVGEGKPLASPSAWGFTALGSAIGLMIGLAQVVLKEGWVRVETGFRAGREVILSRPETTIGRAEACDIGLFGDPGVDRNHARILREAGHYLLTDTSSQSGTFLNDLRVTQPVRLRSGDAIRVGGNILRFGERSQKPATISQEPESAPDNASSTEPPT